MMVEVPFNSLPGAAAPLTPTQLQLPKSTILQFSSAAAAPTVLTMGGDCQGISPIAAVGGGVGSMTEEEAAAVSCQIINLKNSTLTRVPSSTISDHQHQHHSGMDESALQHQSLLHQQQHQSSSSSLPDGGGGGGAVSSEIMSLRLLMQGKEVGSLIGKKGDNIKRFREESGAKINISDGSTVERIVTITGVVDTIVSAFHLIARKFEEDNRLLFSNSHGHHHHHHHHHSSSSSSSAISTSEFSTPSSSSGANYFNNPSSSLASSTRSSPRHSPPTHGGERDYHHSSSSLCLKLIIPASQCGCLIGKNGAKIKELKEMTGATVQVSQEMLPNSTERTVSVAGSVSSITPCVKEICHIIQDSPPRGSTIPYRPKPLVNPMALAQAANVAALSIAQPFFLPPFSAGGGMPGGVPGQFNTAGAAAIQNTPSGPTASINLAALNGVPPGGVSMALGGMQSPPAAITTPPAAAMGAATAMQHQHLGATPIPAPGAYSAAGGTSGATVIYSQSPGAIAAAPPGTDLTTYYQFAAAAPAGAAPTGIAPQSINQPQFAISSPPTAAATGIPNGFLPQNAATILPPQNAQLATFQSPLGAFSPAATGQPFQQQIAFAAAMPPGGIPATATAAAIQSANTLAAMPPQAFATNAGAAVPTAAQFIPGVGFVMRPILNGYSTGAAATVPQAAVEHTLEMTIPNELMGCVMGRNGGKINEIRKQSGATIKISNIEESGLDRKVTMTGSIERIQLAHYLITATIMAKSCGAI